MDVETRGYLRPPPMRFAKADSDPASILIDKLDTRSLQGLPKHLNSRRIGLQVPRLGFEPLHCGERHG